MSLPPPEDATQDQIVRELGALSDWAKCQGFDNVMYRLNWVLRAVSKRHDLKSKSSKCDDEIRARRAQGETFPNLADEYGITKQRVHQICKTEGE